MIGRRDFIGHFEFSADTEHDIATFDRLKEGFQRPKDLTQKLVAWAPIHQEGRGLMIYVDETGSLVGVIMEKFMLEYISGVDS